MLLSCPLSLRILPELSSKNKIFTLTIALLLSFCFWVSTVYTADAGYGRYNRLSIDYYDPSSGYYYRSVNGPQKEGGFLSSKSRSRNISNIFLFNPATNKGHLLFADKNPARKITLFAHENIFVPLETPPSKQRRLEFHKYGSLPLHYANQPIERPIRDHMLVGVALPKAKQTELWHCKKDGSDLKKLITVPKGASWHIDLKAMKIRVLVPDSKQGYRVTNFDW